MNMLIDSHCHLQFAEFDRYRRNTLDRAWKADVRAVVVAGIDIDTSTKAVTLQRRLLEEETFRGARDHSEADLAEVELYATIGQHPNSAHKFTHQAATSFRRLARFRNVVAVGEIGLDFYRKLSPPDAQRAVFQQMLDLAAELRLPVVIHSRAAEEETFAILSGWAAQVRGQWPQERPLGVVHCFGGDLALALRYLQLGFIISIAANVTYPNADRLASVVAGLPLDRLLVETDAPYLTPQALKPQRNEPAFLVETVGRIAEIRAQTVREVAGQTAANAAALYGIAQAGESEPAERREAP